LRTVYAPGRGKIIGMMGGGELIASFPDAGEIEGFDIHVIPILIGAGIALGAPRYLDVPRRLRSVRNYPDDGVVRLRYEVARQNL
jgi:dihydrofolate reductase